MPPPLVFVNNADKPTLADPLQVKAPFHYAPFYFVVSLRLTFPEYFSFDHYNGQFASKEGQAKLLAHFCPFCALEFSTGAAMFVIDDDIISACVHRKTEIETLISTT
mmetsp:Transcript_46495/g.77262  ORF Transcript_46495/g.77262 Transcript_46495/m.77262 type:complete len:107 (-) Transcript_46495:330-650(-)